MSDTGRSHKNMSLGVGMPITLNDGARPKDGGEQGAAAPQTSKPLPANSYRWMTQPVGELHGGSAEEPRQQTTAPAEDLDCFSERSQGWKRGGGDLKAGGVRDEDEAVADEKSGGESRGGVGERLKMGSRREVPAQSDTATAFVNEEEMVVKAIKNFRLLSNATNTSNESSVRSPRWRAAVERAKPCSSSYRTSTNDCGAIWTPGDVAMGPGGKKWGGNIPLSSQGRVQQGANATPQSSVKHAHSRGELRQSHSAGGRKASGGNNFCEGNDWLFKVNSAVKDLSRKCSRR